MRQRIILKQKWRYLYYLILLLVLISWSKTTSAPPMPIRFVFLAFVVIPAVFSRDWLPAVITCFISITLFGYSYSYLPTTLYIYAGLLLFCAWICFRNLSGHIKIPAEMILLLILISAMDFVTGGHLENSTYSLVCVTVLGLFISNDSSDSVDKMTLAFAVSSLVLSIFFLTSYQTYAVSFGFNTGIERSGWTDPNYFGMVVGMGTITSMVHFFRRHNTSFLDKTLYWCTIAISIIVLVLNASRGALLSVALSFVVLVFLSKIKVRYKIIVAILAIGFITLLYANNYFDLLLYRIESDEGTGSGRTEIWMRKLNAFSSEANIFQLIFGFGYKHGSNLGFNHAQGSHNDYIAFLIDYGIVGLLCLISFLTHPLRIKQNRITRPIAVACCFYLAVCCMTLEPLSLGAIPFWLFYLYILSLVYSSNAEDRQQFQHNRELDKTITNE
jgi:O-antigen ligase